jgi:phosphate transport system permease protein
VTATVTPQRTGPEPPPASPSRSTRRGDRAFEAIVRVAAFTILVALVAVFVFLAIEGWQGLTAPSDVYAPFTSFTSYIWPLVVSTLLASAIALLVGAPFAIAVALFISHYAPRRLASVLGYVVDLLAAIPSVVFGLWGGRYLAAWLQPFHVWLHDKLGFLPFFGPGPPSANGRSLFTAGIVLAIMILPIITAISREVFLQTPRLHEEAALALGATRWEMIRYAVFPYARSGMTSGIMLGLGRALGETMAVAMVLATTPLMTLNVIGTASPPTIAANIALNYKESTPERQSLLIATGLVLFLVTFLVNFAARWIAGRKARRLAQ